jgi:hypothetical protein
MTRLEHDGAASLTVKWLRAGNNVAADYSVVRTCACHFGERITVGFDDRERAERALNVLDEDARRRDPSPAPPPGP